MTITITLTSAGSDSGPFDIYGNSTGSFVLITSGVSRLSLTSGYTTTAPDGTTVVRVQSTGTCTNYQDIPVQTTTTTVAPTTVPPTTAAPCYNYEIIAYNDGSGCEGYINYSYYDCNNVYQTGGSVSVGTTQYECARDYPAITCGNGQVSYMGACGSGTVLTTTTTTASPTCMLYSFNNGNEQSMTIYYIDCLGETVPQYIAAGGGGYFCGLAGQTFTEEFSGIAGGVSEIEPCP